MSTQIISSHIGTRVFYFANQGSSMAIGDWQSMLAKADRVIGWRFDDEQPERVVPLCAFGEHPLEKLTYGEGPEYFRAIIHPDGSVETSWSEGFPNFNAFHSSYARRAVENK